MAAERPDRDKRNEARRAQIIEAAEELFANKGVNAVSLNEINKAAGQKNNNALHYHFGSREALIEAIIDLHHSKLMARLEGPLHQLMAVPRAEQTLRQILTTYIEPFVGLLDEKRGRYYIQIVTQLLYIDVDLAIEPRAINQRERLESLISAKIPQTSSELLNLRTIAFIHVMFNTLSLYSQMTPKKAREVFGSRSDLEYNLVLVLEGILSAGATPQL